MQLPFADEAFDVVVCQFGVMSFPDKSKAFAEARRVLRSGGVLIFSGWDRIRENEFADTVTTALESVFSRRPSLLHGPHTARLSRPPHHRARCRQWRVHDISSFCDGCDSQPGSLSPGASDRLLPGDAASERDQCARRLSAQRSNRCRGGGYRATVRARGGGRQDPGVRCHYRRLTVLNLGCCALTPRMLMGPRCSGTTAAAG
jgi:hypothetical protein